MKTTDSQNVPTNLEPPKEQPATASPLPPATPEPAKPQRTSIVKRAARLTGRIARRTLKVAVLVIGVVLLLTAGASIWGNASVGVQHPAPPPIINDVTQLNPIVVRRVLEPTTLEEIADAVKNPGPISIGGGRYSMGGQTATNGGLQIDMRRFNKVIAFDSIGKTITVQPGIRWRQIQERIDSANLSIKIMQTYSNFTVGGSLSVNVHGRYIGLGPLVLSVRSIKLVLADGSVVEASREKNPHIFFGAIGGYGSLGVIVEATLELADNVHVKRLDQTMPVSAYRPFFNKQIRDSAAVIFHNGDIYPPNFDGVNAVTYVETNDPVTVPERLIPKDRSYRLNRFVYWMISEWPGGKWMRRHIVDPLIFRGEPVEWRNYEASYDVADLEPSSRESSTYVLQEYFVPVEHFEEFVPKMAAVFKKHDVNIINVSIRHALPDTGTLLSWSPRETFAFVVYYKQGTDTEARRKVGVWTREMIDSVLTVSGAYYLPYQPWATDAQFHRAYPRADSLFALKRKFDPTAKFTNTLWDKYYVPRVHPEQAPLGIEARVRLDSTSGYLRDEGQTFLTHPEWYIVYSSDEYADWLQTKLPTSFPYVASIGQFWANYREARALTSNAYPFNFGYHVMLWVIGTSYSAELMLKGLYENTIGRFSGWTAGHQLSDEDRFAARVAADYGKFIHIRPWYEYKFTHELGGLWGDVPLWGAHEFRKLERRFFLTIEYGIKAIYATVIEKATRAAYTPQDDRMQFAAVGWSDSLARAYPTIESRGKLDSVHTLLAAPRYDAFRDLMLELGRAHAPVQLTEIAGNDDILITGVAPSDWRSADYRARVVYTMTLPSDIARKRVTMRVRVSDLVSVLGAIGEEGKLKVDHIYDY
jgi:FAD/FMN-containing dehydrogenase